MLGRTMLAATALALTALTVPAAQPDARAVMNDDRVVRLSNADARGEVVVGQQVTVSLEPSTQGDLKVEWDALTSSDENVLKPDGAASVGSATFKALSAGTADITAKAICKDAAGAQQDCPEGTDWKATVEVADAPDPA
ncbi:hypothetical protein [Streptomyces huasconensis]|uniref:hypothetical protein n=1 Tax=Streptomyces huasconensis TaxID=1854574 RepID=UPI0033FE1FE6